MILIQKLTSLAQANRVLRGGIQGGTSLIQGGAPLYLHNRTLIFTAPVAETVTFDTGGEQVPMSLQELKTQLELQTTGVVASFEESRLVLNSPTGVAITALGTANAHLGFSTTQPTVGTIYGAPSADAAPRFIAVSESDGVFTLITEEA